MTTVTRNYLEVSQINRKFTLTALPAGMVADNTYVAVRGVDSEPGAVQRILTSRRISSVAEFVLRGGDFPGAIILNWQERLNKKNHKLRITTQQDLAQIIDGQHRVAGLKEAIKQNPELKKLDIPVVIYEQLSTQECADIFLSINTEQKPVARSLVFDLYGVSSDLTSDPAIVRARDIAEYLNEVSESPYHSSIKFPGEKRRKGGVALSSAVTAIKELVMSKGSFDQVGVTELEVQKKCLMNFFTALSEIYGEEWQSRTNAFQYAAGFTAACQFLQLKIIPYCSSKSSFEAKVIRNALPLDRKGLILQDEVKLQSGSEAVNIIYERLSDAFSPDTRTKPIKF
ncbi:MAG: DGQHR domain-containing protein [Halieaceae bacterium]